MAASSAKGPRLPGARTRQHEVFTVPVCREQLQPATRLLPAVTRRACFFPSHFCRLRPGAGEGTGDTEEAWLRLR